VQPVATGIVYAVAVRGSTGLRYLVFINSYYYLLSQQANVAGIAITVV
jgi:hypothetical protein